MNNAAERRIFRKMEGFVAIFARFSVNQADMERGFAVVGLGYVGLPVALALARKFSPVIGFDISSARIASLRAGHDTTGEVAAAVLRETRLQLTDDPQALAEASFVIVTVPTPIDSERRPDLKPLSDACALIGSRLKPGAVVVFESTVYPGLTREFCGPLLAKASGLRQGVDFNLGYSPERINPGDNKHRLETIVKVVAGEDPDTLERVAAVYDRIVDAGLHRAPSLEIAEAAKVIENTQRDLNIALMNELAIIFDRFGIPTRDVLAAAGTKWNFLRFTPGLVGGHCIGVDPYYLTARAEAAGYYPQVILSGRRINDGMGGFIAQRLVKLLIAAERPVKGARVGIVGLAFKENVPDLRNSRVPDIVAELREFGIAAMVADPLADAEEARRQYRIELVATDALADLDGLILAVPHRVLAKAGWTWLFSALQPGGVVIDVKSAIDRAEVPPGLRYWSL
jgi:UDP-N-acetyl-D-glucosamine/UDP-N-acetyl-D-galactosamine dehydrogenase